ncbi:MAG: 5-amino-6-(D-ribitylamino)uracil--L-tyrosine 4-hydroxyphenyl transferase CofH [Actinomycetota bacterium]|nr:5-amino-6-(D-ribitylamino)uracil--L-tyrosine 4-hydroxyphenyl transferase CofH [Actinomycetota bacterium]
MTVESALLSRGLDEMLAEARAVRDAAFGNRVTFSPRVLIALSEGSQDSSAHCTSAQPRPGAASAYLGPDEALAIAANGARAGCHEALLSLPERAEEHHEVAGAWLAEHGYATTLGYLIAMADLVRSKTGLLVQTAAGALRRDELAVLRRVAASQAVTLGSLRQDLVTRCAAAGRIPMAPLASLEAAGELAIPSSAAILVGAGESRADRLETLSAIAASHRRHGHVQEVIVQGFVPVAGTDMGNEPGEPLEEHLWSIAAARLVLPADVHVQAPPQMSGDFGLALDAGIDDWGGLSPAATAGDPASELAWTSLDRLRRATEERCHTLAPRLSIYPEFALEPGRWLDPNLSFAVMDRSDAEGLGRDDPGAVFPEQVSGTRQVGDGAEVIIVGERSTAWYSGAPVQPPVLVQGRPRGRVMRGGAVAEVLSGVQAGQEPGVDELVTLFSARGREVEAVAEMADDLRREAVGETVTWVHNRNINYTNICTFKCRFCGFSKGPLSLNLRGRPYLLSLEDIAQRVREAWDLGATEVTLQGGIHPDFDGDYYVEVCKAVVEAAPGIHVHGFSALEVTEGAKRLGEPLADYLRRLMSAGLKSLPGTAAEILDDDIRAILCPDKVTTEEWLFAHETAHEVGLRSNVTIMHGAVEQPIHWARHLVRTRDLQKRTGGFTELVPLPFVHMASPIYLQRKARRGPTFRELLLMHAVGRIACRGQIDNIQASWVKTGIDGVRQLLQAGVNDLGGTLMDENISRAAGASHGQGLTPTDFAAIVSPLGRPLRQRSTLYGDAARRGAVRVG